MDPPILILDEATSMYDPDGEEHFITRARESFGKKTVLLITHRPASLELADRVYYLSPAKKGPVTAEHSSLDYNAR